MAKCSSKYLSLHVKKICFRIMENIIRDLKERSGKSTKVKVETSKELQLNGAAFFIFFLSSPLGRFCLLLSAEEKSKFGISGGKDFFIKNLTHVSSVSTIPIFRVSNSSVLTVSRRPSQVTEDVFSTEDISMVMSEINVEMIGSGAGDREDPQPGPSTSPDIVLL